MRRPSRYCAVLMATLVLPTTAVWAEDAKLEGAAAWQALVGNTIVANSKAGSYTEYYEPGGTLRRADADGATKGQWSLSGDKVCLDYPEDDDRICLKVAVEGTSGRFTDDDGTVDAFQILPGNAKGL